TGRSWNTCAPRTITTSSTTRATPASAWSAGNDALQMDDRDDTGPRCRQRRLRASLDGDVRVGQGADAGWHHRQVGVDPATHVHLDRRARQRRQGGTVGLRRHEPELARPARLEPEIPDPRGQSEAGVLPAARWPARWVLRASDAA